MRHYSDLPENFKLLRIVNAADKESRAIGIFFMWLSGLGVPEPFHEFVAAVFRAGNWEDTEEDEITLKRMARAISPGTDADHSILRAYNRLKKSSLKFFEWQEQQEFEIIGKTVTGIKKGTRSLYRFHHYQLLMKLFNLPETFTQKQVRAEVSKALGNLALPPPTPRKRKQRRAESIAATNTRSLEELLALTSSPTEAGLCLSEAWRASLGDAVVEEIIRSLNKY